MACSVGYPDKQGHCFWKDMLLLNVLNVIFQCCVPHKLNLMNFFCFGMMAEISEEDLPKQNYLHGWITSEIGERICTFIIWLSRHLNKHWICFLSDCLNVLIVHYVSTKSRDVVHLQWTYCSVFILLRGNYSQWRQRKKMIQCGAN